MGVPAFFRWLSEKYPKTVIDMVEQRPQVIDGSTVPLELTEPNPNGMEFDNLYIDMNGIIHPCSHPEDRPMPKTEAEMFVNVMQYVDRIFAAVRPRKLIFMAIDGVAPRAKMNQQRTRRFRAAGDARDRHEIKMQTRQEMIELGLNVPPEELDKEWDSNVITPGTEFMTQLATYLRFYMAHRINTSKAWQQIKVLFSDGSEPGEGEHKIMDFIRKERAQPGYDPNTRHVLHGLDADLIMLALATHEPHFTILREQVFFGRKGRDQQQQGQSQAQQAFDAMQGQKTDLAFARGEGDHFPYLKPFQMLHIPTLREYLQVEFQCLERGALPFAFDFERVVDDFVFLCFFVGNDFLPHLPSLDIRDGAIDFLLNVYKRVLPAMGDYLTSPGGCVNLEKVDIILGEVGRVEDEVFRRRRASEEQHRRRLDQKIKGVERRYGGTVQELASKIRPDDLVALGQSRKPLLPPPMPVNGYPNLHFKQQQQQQSEEEEIRKKKEEANVKNMKTAAALREALRKKTQALKRERSSSEDETAAAATSTSSNVKKEEDGEAGENGSTCTETVATASDNDATAAAADAVSGPSPSKRMKLESTTAEASKTTIKTEGGSLEMEVSTEVSITLGEAPSAEAEGEDEEEAEVDDEEEEEKEEFEKAHIIVPPELEGTELAAATKELEARVKSKQEAKLDRLKEEIDDTIRYHEAGWKDRYYQDKLKKHNVEKGGGREHMYKTYIEGLIWVFQYYYRGCQAWGWFYPFHYAPFASDLVNIDRYKIEFELGTPLRPLEQLMAVLPPESADALPLPLARLMTSEDSPIKDFYPREVEVDPNGKAMPWLWVTLLPFIDEKRLLDVIHEVEPQLSPAERKRNELGSSVLCLHEYHPTFRAISDVLKEDDPSARLELAAGTYDGFSGTLTKPPPEATLAIGALISAPRTPPYALQDVDDNRALVASFQLPPQSAPHASALLAGLTPPARRLSQHDLVPRRPPRLGRGFNIAELGQQFGFTEMHAVQRLIVNNAPRGNMMMSASMHHHSYHQQGYGNGIGGAGYGATGNRSWGSMEPGINQQKHQYPPLPPPSLYPQQLQGRGGMPSAAPRLLLPPGGGGHAQPPLPPGPPPLMPGLGQQQQRQPVGYPPPPPGPPPAPPRPPLMAPMLFPQPPMMMGAFGGGGGGGGHPLLRPPRPLHAPPPPPSLHGPNAAFLNSLRQSVAATLQERKKEGVRGGGGANSRAPHQQQHHHQRRR